MTETLWIDDDDLTLAKRVTPRAGMIVTDAGARDQWLIVHIELGRDAWSVIKMTGQPELGMQRVRFSELIAWLNENELQEVEE